jgi:type I restriction enzyme S subunit
MTSSTLPAGWREIQLGDCADFEMGQAPPGASCNFTGEGTPFVKAGEFGESRPIIREWTTQPLKFAKRTDVLVCVVGATAGKTNLGADCAIGRSVGAVRPSAGVDQIFLFNFLSQQTKRLRAESTGSAQGVISRDQLASLSFPLPPLAEQRRIVAKLNALSARSKRARAELERVEALAERGMRALAESLFSSEPRDGYEIRPLSELIDTGPSNGWSPKSGDDASGALTLKLSATTTGRMVLSPKTTKRIYDNPASDSPFWLRPGDLLVQRANTIEYVGSSAIYDGPEKTYIYPDLMMRIRITDPALRFYVCLYLNSPPARRYLQARATGTAGNMPKISGATLRNLPVPIPTVPGGIQEAVTRMQALGSATDRTLAECGTAHRLLSRLDASILSRAFRGELVPQDPSDEPAGVLLDRIRAERDAGGAAPKRRRRAG